MKLDDVLHTYQLFVAIVVESRRMWKPDGNGGMYIK